MERIKRRKYTREFQAEAVKMVEAGRQQAEVARELGITGNTLWNWVEQARKERERSPSDLTTEEREELRKLRREVADLREEREILKKRRPSSPSTTSEICLHQGGEGPLPSSQALRGSRGQPPRVLRLAQA